MKLDPQSSASASSAIRLSVVGFEPTRSWCSDQLSYPRYKCGAGVEPATSTVKKEHCMCRRHAGGEAPWHHGDIQRPSSGPVPRNLLRCFPFSGEDHCAESTVCKERSSGIPTTAPAAHPRWGSQHCRKTKNPVFRDRVPAME
jgi:hypothetical protein